VLADLLHGEAERDPSNYLNINAVTVPTDRSQPFGTAGRNTVRVARSSGRRPGLA
jgi:hypothetical protein